LSFPSKYTSTDGKRMIRNDESGGWIDCFYYIWGVGKLEEVGCHLREFVHRLGRFRSLEYWITCMDGWMEVEVVGNVR
jgi:hypothetical protein